MPNPWLAWVLSEETKWVTSEPRLWVTSTVLSAPDPAPWLTHAKSVLCKDMSSQVGDNMRNSSCFSAGFPISFSFEMSLLLIRHFHWKSSNCQQQFTQQGSVSFCLNMVNGALWNWVFRCLLDQGVFPLVLVRFFHNLIFGFKVLSELKFSGTCWVKKKKKKRHGFWFSFVLSAQNTWNPLRWDFRTALVHVSLKFFGHSLLKDS